MENIKAPIVDFTTHLQQILDEISLNSFEVSNIRNMNTSDERINVVVTALAGSVYQNSATLPFAIEVLTNQPDEVINIFTALAKARNNKSFIEVVEEESGVKEYTVFEFYTTPSPVEKDVNYNNNNCTRILMYATLNILFEVGNVSKIEIDGESIEFSTGSVNYGVEQFSVRETGGNLNNAVKKSATTSVQIAMINKTSNFTNKVFKIMFGLLGGNTKFECKITLTNGFVGNLTTILNTNTFNFAQNTPNLPSLNIVLVKAQEE